MAGPLAPRPQRGPLVQEVLPGRPGNGTRVQDAAPPAIRQNGDQGLPASGGTPVEQGRVVSACPRCRGDHGELRFQRVARPLRVADWLTAWWWTLCPATREPVLWASIRPSARGKAPRRGRLQ